MILNNAFLAILLSIAIVERVNAQGIVMESSEPEVPDVVVVKEVVDGQVVYKAGNGDIVEPIVDPDIWTAFPTPPPVVTAPPTTYPTPLSPAPTANPYYLWDLGSHDECILDTELLKDDCLEASLLVGKGTYNFPYYLNLVEDPTIPCGCMLYFTTNGEPIVNYNTNTLAVGGCAANNNARLVCRIPPPTMTPSYAPTSLETTPWFSEENGGLSERMNGPIMKVYCSGSRCNNKRLEGVDMDPNNLDFGSSTWTHWFSEDLGNANAQCPSNKFVTRVQCSGDNCDDIRLECTPFSGSSSYELYSNIQTTHWFSEEAPDYASCQTGYALSGMYCDGSDCDNIKLSCRRWSHQLTQAPTPDPTPAPTTAEPTGTPTQFPTYPAGTCFNVRFQTDLNPASHGKKGDGGNYQIEGYGRLPGGCHTGRWGGCNMQFCGLANDELKITAVTSRTWNFGITGDIGPLVDYETWDGTGTHYAPFPTWLGGGKDKSLTFKLQKAPTAAPTPNPTLVPTPAPTLLVETYTFPATTTSYFVHGICVQTTGTASASANVNSLTYTAINNPQTGTQVWGDRNYQLSGVAGSVCAGSTYLQPSKHNAVYANTQITVQATFPSGTSAPSATICMLVEKVLNGNARDGGFISSLTASDNLMIDYGDNTGLGYNYGSGIPFHVFCRTKPDPQYYRVTSGTCPSNGYNYITSADECKTAGLLFGQVWSGGTDSTSDCQQNRPRNCGMWSTRWIHYNARTSGPCNSYTILQQAGSGASMICKG